MFLLTHIEASVENVDCFITSWKLLSVTAHLKVIKGAIDYLVERK